jgi:GH18 family chitinase
VYRFVNIIIFCFAAVCVFSCAKSDLKKREPRPFRIVGYLPEYRLNTIHNSWGKHLTDIIYFSIEPKASGEIDTSRVNEKALRQLKAVARQNKVRILICLGGWGCSKGFGLMATDKNCRRRFVRNLTKFCKKRGFAGADFDWEFPRGKQEQDAYSALLVETKNMFQPHGMIVTVAVKSNQRLTADAYKAVDYIHLMSYNHGAKHATYYASVADTQRQLAYGAPKEKLCLGVPFYGRNMNNRRDARSYAELVTGYHPAPGVNNVGGIYFNGINTIQQKTRYAMKKKLAGIMIWEIGQDTFDDTSLLGAINRAVSDTNVRQ